MRLREELALNLSQWLAMFVDHWRREDNEEAFSWFEEGGYKMDGTAYLIPPREIPQDLLPLFADDRLVLCAWIDVSDHTEHLAAAEEEFECVLRLLPRSLRFSCWRSKERMLLELAPSRRKVKDLLPDVKSLAEFSQSERNEFEALLRRRVASFDHLTWPARFVKMELADRGISVS